MSKAPKRVAPADLTGLPVDRGYAWVIAFGEFGFGTCTSDKVGTHEDYYFSPACSVLSA